MVKRKNLIWAALFAAVIAACLIFIFLTGGKSGENSAEIYENGKLIKTVSDLSPDKEYSFEIKTENGTNTITVGEEVFGCLSQIARTRPVFMQERYPTQDRPSFVLRTSL